MIREEEIYRIGIFNKPHGVKGELSFTFTDDSFDRAGCDYLICPIDGIFVPFFVEEYRFRSETTALVKLEDVDTADKARMFTNVPVYFPKRLAGEAPSGRPLSWGFFTGFRVTDERHGLVGTITDVDDSTANTLFIMEHAGREFMIPAREELIRQIDRCGQTVRVCLPDGLLEMDEPAGTDCRTAIPQEDP